MTESRIGKYKIVGELGRGAMGIVYKAEDPYIGRIVAIKTIRFDVISQSSQKEEAQKRFLREAQSAGNLSHPNIVTVYDVGEDQGMTYIAMEYIEGKSLEELLESRKKFSIEEAIALMIPVADALESAHRKGIVHRDIKPGNILIDQEGRPYLVDFGIARISTSTMTQTSMVMGTPFYMSPEQVAGKRVDNRSDIFALGAILYEMLTLQKPFPGESLTTVIYKIMNEEPQPTRTFQRDVPEGIDYVIRRAMAKDPGSRYQTCREFIEDLRNYSRFIGQPLPTGEAVAGRGTEIRTEPVALEFQPERSRKPLLVILASMMAVVVIAVVAVFLFTRGNKQIPSTSPGGGPSGISTPSLVSIQDFLKAGNDFWSNKNYTEAIQKFEEVLAKDPQNFEAQLSIAGILKEQGKLDEAVPEYEKAMALNRNDGRSYQHLGQIFEQKQDFQKSIDYYRQCLSVMTAGAEADLIAQKVADLESRLSTLTPPEKPEDAGANKPEATQVQTPQDKQDTPQKDKPEKPEESKVESKTESVPPVKKTESPTVPEKKKETPPEVKPVEVKVKKEETETEIPPVKKIEPSPEEIRKKEEAELMRKIERGIEAIDRENYDQAIQQLEEVLRIDPQNKLAKDYLTIARKRLDEKSKKQNIMSGLENANRAMQNNDHKKVIEECLKVLKADPNNEEAKNLISAATVKVTPNEVNSLVNQYVQAVQSKKLIDFYRKNCSPSLFSRINRDTELFFSMYDNLSAIASNIRINFQDTTYEGFKVEVKFSHIMTGVSRERGIREALFEGIYRWNLERRGDGWVITNINFETQK